MSLPCGFVCSCVNSKYHDVREPDDHPPTRAASSTLSMSGLIIDPTNLKEDYMVAYTAAKAGAKHLTSSWTAVDN